MKILKFISILIIFSFIFSCGGSGGTQNTNTTTQNYTILIPLYSYPNGQYASEWEKLLSFKPKPNATVIVVINPNNGQGNQADNVFVEKINQLKSKNFKVLGYIYTNYSNRDLNEVKNDVDKWITLYGNIDGFFIDEAVNGKSEYYRQITDYIKSKSQNILTIGNIGTEVTTDYFSIFDKIVIAEMPYQQFLNYSLHYDYSKIEPQNKCVIVYDVKDVNQFENAKNIALKLNSLCMYFTNYSANEIYFKISDYLDKI